ncbi:MAG: hypothetical protein LBS07_03430 [Prevotellaceae bacterium]|jgi:hypothetical protein|nr:hypothetical protein [Prevotellaceae bacterium]
MTTTELKKKIAEATEQEWFKTTSANFNFTIGKQQSFTGVSAIFEFVNQQVEGWNKLENLPPKLRQNITYFYLSLLKDSKVADSERQLIMQSLFSRADTGSLKEDSSPTMPNDYISKVMSKQ